MPKITGLSISNFKGIRDPIHIDLRPITLLFGANSAGKSTVFHALHYAREIFERRNLNPDRTVAGGAFVDLGGFESFVHQHDRDKKVVICLTLQADSEDLSSAVDDSMNLVSHASALRPFDVPSIEHFCKEFTSISVEVAVGWSHQISRAYVHSYKVKLDGETIASLHHEPGRVETTLTINLEHPAWKPVSGSEKQQHGEFFDVEVPTLIMPFLDDADAEQAFPFWEIYFSNEDGTEPILRIPLETSGDALPDFGKPLAFANRFVEESLSRESGGQSKALEMLSCISELASQLVLAPGILLRQCLTEMRYLGPLRETPSRNFSPPKFADPSRWSSGLGAWDQLLLEGSSLVDAVSEWLVAEDRLDSGYSLESRRYKELDLGDPLIHKLITGRAFDEVDNDSALNLHQLPTYEKLFLIAKHGAVEHQPHDVGIGISQVVPVVVSALDDSERLILIEQPELHLHPRLQSELGDLFIESALGKSQHSVILETHSEHLILRLLRRIRETTEGDITDGQHPLTPEDIAVYYIQPTTEGAKIDLLEVDETGDFKYQWPNGFFEERAKELF